MQNRKPLIMLVLAILIALVVTLFAYNWLQERSVALKSLETQDIVVASIDMAWATVISREMVKVVPYLKTSLPDGYYIDPAGLEGRTLIYPVRANEPIFESKLAPSGLKGGGVAAVITPQKRAMAVKVDKVVGVSGFVHPGNRVDVLVTIANTGPGRVDAPVTKIVLENVLVLAAGPDLSLAGKQEKPNQVDVITLEVSPQEGEKLAMAASEGKLQLALRNFTDTEEVVTKGITIPTLLASYGNAAPAAKPVRRASAKSEGGVKVFRVELIRGTNVSQVKIDTKGE